MRTFLPIILILLSIGLFFMFIDPQYAIVRGLMDQRAEYKAAIADMEAIQERRNALETQFADLPQESVDRLAKVLPQKLNTVKLAADLDAIASRFGVSIRDFSVPDMNVDASSKVTTNTKPYNTSTVSFSAIGSYANFTAFIKEVEKSLQLIDVKTINMKSGGQEGGPLQFNVNLHTYWVK